MVPIILAGCGSWYETRHLPFETLNLEPSIRGLRGSGWSLIWTESLVGVQLQRDYFGEDAHVLINLETQEITNLTFASPVDCVAEYYIAFTVLPDGRWGALLKCWTQLSGKVSPIQSYLLAMEPDTWEIEVLNLGDLPDSRYVSSYTWNADMTRGVQALSGAGLEPILYWISPDGYEPMDILITQGEQSWNMAEYFRGAERLTGLASSPAWSPTDDRIAFFATAVDEEIQGLSLIGIKYSLYMMDAEEMAPKEMLSGMIAPWGLLWSPDGRWLVFAAQKNYFSGSDNHQKLWMYDSQSNALIQIGEGRFSDFTWDKTGRYLAAVVCIHSPGEDCDKTEIRIYDLRELVE